MKHQTAHRLAGVGIALTSLSLIMASDRRRRAGGSGAFLLLTGITGLVAATAVAYRPERQAQRGLAMHNVLEDEDAELIDAHLAELLGAANDAPFPTEDGEG